MIEPTPGFVDHSLQEADALLKDVAKECPKPGERKTFDILAIDPGTTESAFLEWQDGKINDLGIVSNSQLLAMLRESHPTQQVCIEMVASYGMAVGREVFETVLWIGRFFQQSVVYPRCDPRLIYRRDVKMHHCGSARAKDANIRQALIDKYGAPGTKHAPGLTYGLKSHLWSAFAIATFVSEQYARKV
jgi:hypothetical protein